MFNSRCKALVRLGLVMALTFSGATAMAVDGSWTAVGDGNWSDTANWDGGIIAGGVDATATFNNAAGKVTVDVPTTVGHLVIPGALNRDFDGPGLTLAVSAGSPTIALSVQTAWHAPISGTQGFTLSGSALQNFVTHLYSGPTVIDSNIVIRNNEALGVGGAGNGTTIKSGDVLGFQGPTAVNYTTNEPLFITGTTVGSGAIRNVSGGNTFAGDITLLNSTWVGGEGGSLTLTGQISGGPTANLRKVGGATYNLNGNNTYLGSTTIAGGTVNVNGSLANANITVGTTLGGTGVIKFNLGEMITVNGTMNASALEFDLTSFGPAGADLTIVDYTLGTFNAPGSLQDLLTPASIAQGWVLTDTGTTITAFLPEPASLALMILAGTMLGGRLPRRHPNERQMKE